MALSFEITNSGGVAWAPNVYSYELYDQFLGHSALTIYLSAAEFRSHEANRAARIAVIGPGDEVVFSGYFDSLVDGSGQGLSDRRRRMMMKFYGFSRKLTLRTFFPRTIPSGTSIFSQMSDQAGSLGWLHEANSLVPQNSWTLVGGYPNYTFQGTGLSVLEAWQSPVMYRSTTQLTRNFSGLPDIDEFYMGGIGIGLRVRFATDDDPSTYPVFFEGFKDTRIRRYADVPDQTLVLSNDITVGWQHTMWGVLRNMFRGENLEWRFIPDADGYTYLTWAEHLGSGDEFTPAATFTEGVDLLNVQFGKNKDWETLTVSCPDGAYCDSELVRIDNYMEKLIFEAEYNLAQCEDAAVWERRHRTTDYMYVRAKARYDLRPGDWIGVQLLESNDFVGGRIESMVEKDGIISYHCNQLYCEDW